MHPVKAYFEQQYGFALNRNYEPHLSRLRCLKNDDFTQIYPSHDGFTDTPIFACKFSEQRGYENLLALANEDGKIAIHNVNKSGDRWGLRGHNNAIFDLTWLFQQMKIVTASGDHSSKLYDVANSGITEDRTFCRHERSVKSIASSKFDPSIFATGGRDGNIIVWDIRADKSESTFIEKSDIVIRKSHVTKIMTPSRSKKAVPMVTQNNSVTGLVFQDSNTLISCGAGDGCIKIWDLRKTHYNTKRESVSKLTLPYFGKSAKNGFSNLVVDAECQKLYANCLDNNIYCYDIGTYNSSPVMMYTGHQNNTFYIKSALSSDGLYLISGSSDENAYIWNLKYSEPICKLIGHTAEVTCVAWCKDSEPCIVTCSDDIKHKIWRIGTEDLPDNFEIEGKGRTEIVPMFTKSRRNIPKRLIVNQEIFREPPKKFIISCERCLSTTSNERLCNKCSCTKKRKSFENFEDSKRMHTDFGPKKLFCNLGDNENIDLGDNLKKRKYKDVALSPLKDLPNFVLDGVAPHLNFSPPKKKHCDWLTRMRIDHSFKRKMMDNSEEQLLKISKLETTPKNKPLTKSAVQKSPLLKYFKLTNSSTVLKNCNNSTISIIGRDIKKS